MRALVATGFGAKHYCYKKQFLPSDPHLTSPSWHMFSGARLLKNIRRNCHKNFQDSISCKVKKKTLSTNLLLVKLRLFHCLLGLGRQFLRRVQRSLILRRWLFRSLLLKKQTPDIYIMEPIQYNKIRENILSTLP